MLEPVPELHAPHRRIVAADGRERFAVKLFDMLWERYRTRVSYAWEYERVIVNNRASFVNDHIAFRTIAAQKPADGIFSLGRLFQALGYEPAACYQFPDKHLASIHFAHPNPDFPKLFISELKSWELSNKSRVIIRNVMKSRKHGVSDELLDDLIRAKSVSTPAAQRLLERALDVFRIVPWPPPNGVDVVALNRESQFGAWVLLNGYEVNHFTALVNSHRSPALDTIEKTVDALKESGVPMKKVIEGAKGSILRQSSTESVVLPFTVRGLRGPATLAWPYAYFEIAERGMLKDPKTGKRTRFEGFLGAQATSLFDMTKRK